MPGGSRAAGQGRSGPRRGSAQGRSQSRRLGAGGRPLKRPGSLPPPASPAPPPPAARAPPRSPAPPPPAPPAACARGRLLVTAPSGQSIPGAASGSAAIHFPLKLERWGGTSGRRGGVSGKGRSAGRAVLCIKAWSSVG